MNTDDMDLEFAVWKSMPSKQNAKDYQFAVIATPDQRAIEAHALESEQLVGQPQRIELASPSVDELLGVVRQASTFRT